MLGRDRQMEALQLNNEQLKGAVDSLERELAQRMTDQVSIMTQYYVFNSSII